MTRGPSASGNAAATHVVMLAVSLASLGLGCKKEIDPSAFDAGVASTASSVSVSGTDAGAAAPSAEATEVAPLAPLSSGTPPATPKPAAKPGAAAVKPAAPAAPIAECAKAKQFCEHPAIKTDASIQALCAKYKDECTKKGGHP